MTHYSLQDLQRLKSDIRTLEQLRGGQKIVPLRRLFNARLRGGRVDEEEGSWKHVSYDACPGKDLPMSTADVYGEDFH